MVLQSKWQGIYQDVYGKRSRELVQRNHQGKRRGFKYQQETS